MPFKTSALLFSALLAAAAAAPAQALSVEDRAHQLTQEMLLVDTHIDVPYRLRESWEDVSRATASGEFDHPRAVAGGLDVAFMSIYTPASSELDGSAGLLADQLIDSVEALAGRNPQRFALVRSVADVERERRPGRVLLALGMENGAPIAGELSRLAHYQRRGVRYVTLAHSASNHIADSSYDEARPAGGLTDFGRAVVAEMNRLGMMVDVSHLSDDAVRDVLEESRAPVIASHSSARHFTPGFERNLDDALIRAIAAEGGVVMINFGSSFLSAEANRWYEDYGAAREAWSAETGHATDSPEALTWGEEYRSRVPFPFASVALVADHIEHVVKLVGIAHVGLGSDYDGVGDSLPVGLKSVADYPNLVAELLRRGHDDEAIEAILGGSFMRVWSEVERIAATGSGSGD